MANENNYTVPSEPLTREEEYLDAIVTNTSGGGGSSKYVIDELNVTTNGTYTGTGGVNAYNPVNVNVPNSYTAGDEGKVVSSGELVSQTSTTITSNSTVDTTTNNSVTVNVANSYTAEDEGKVVNSGELVAQTSRTVTTPGIYDTTLNNSFTVDIDIPVEEKDVNFYDYDGTVLYSYTAQEFLALTEMPANPTHEGLTAQGWNWTLSDAKDYVTECGICKIGQLYVTSDNSTRIYVTLSKSTLNPQLGINKGSATSISIDWGDNSPIEVNTEGGYIPHTYATPGDYVISITTEGNINNFYSESNGSLILSDSLGSSNWAYKNSIRKIELSDKIGSPYGSNVFKNLVSLETITSPLYPISIEVGNNAFENCFLLKHINLSLLRIASTEPFRNCYSIENIILPCRTYSLGTMYTIAYNSYNLKQLIIPSSYRSLSNGIISGCNNVKNIVFPSSVSSITSGFTFNASYMQSVKFTRQTPPTLSGTPNGSYANFCIFYVPALVSNLYMTASNYPSSSTYNYIGYATYTSGDTLPTLTTDETYTLTWYATVEDAIAQTNPITVGNGNEVYSVAAPVV